MGKTFMLIMTIIMPPHVPDVSHQERMPSIEACWEAAQKFVERDIEPLRKNGAIGFGASCGVVYPNSVTQ